MLMKSTLMRAVVVLALAILGTPAVAQGLLPDAATSGAATPAKPNATIEKLAGVWIEGPGYDISYGGSYDACAQRCLGTPHCAMIEYYRPEKKCNLYSAVRPRKPGGASDVGIRR
jgi:PAN domain